MKDDSIFPPRANHLRDPGNLAESSDFNSAATDLISLAK